MFDSVRVRLTLWYTAVLTMVLVVLSVSTYLVLRQNTLQRTDANLGELGDTFLATVEAELKDQVGPNALKLAAQEAIVEHRFRENLFAVFDPSGGTVVSSQEYPSSDPTIEKSPMGLFSSGTILNLVSSSANGPIFQNIKGGKRGYRGLFRRFTVNGQTYTLVVLQSLHHQKEFLDEMAQTFALVIPFAILFASVGGYFLARKSLAPVVAMSAQAGLIGARNLHDRLSVKNKRDELGKLALSFNDLLDRLDQSFEQQRRFMADASHELRTPVAILCGESEVTLSRTERTPAEYRESLGVLSAEAQRLKHVVEDLFTLARADTGQYTLAVHEFYLDELVVECVRSTRTLALAKEITLAAALTEELPIFGDEALLRRMILNLLDNAIKYTPRGGRIDVSCEKEGKVYILRVADNGPGIPADLQSRIFERFFRVDKARSRSECDSGGAGLGLSIARWIAEAHEGRLEVSRSDSAGTIFAAILPRDGPAPDSHSAIIR